MSTTIATQNRIIGFLILAIVVAVSWYLGGLVAAVAALALLIALASTLRIDQLERQLSTLREEHAAHVLMAHDKHLRERKDLLVLYQVVHAHLIATNHQLARDLLSRLPHMGDRPS